MTGWIADGSFQLVAQQITGKQLLAVGATGVIGYVSRDPAKNMTARMLGDYLDSGLSVGLVYEDGETDMRNPANGKPYGLRAISQAQAIGYDIYHCVIYSPADWNVQPSELPAVNDFMADFRRVVPHPGIYSNQRTLDMLAVTGNAEYFWQSNSTSYSNGTSVHANLQQRYADRRAGWLPVDVNDIIREPLGMMGGTVGILQDDDKQFILNAVGAGARTAATLTAQDEDGTKNRIVQILQSETADQAVLQQLLTAAKSQGVTIDYDKLASALAAHLLVQVSAK